MTSLYGTFQYFDYESFQKERCTPKKVTTLVYPPDTMMGYLVQHYPHLAHLVTKAKWDKAFADPQARFTFFISDQWEKQPIANLDQMGIHDARAIVMSRLLQGRIRRMDLETSGDSQLSTVLDGVTFHVWKRPDDPRLYLGCHEILVQEHACTNGMIQISKFTP